MCMNKQAMQPPANQPIGFWTARAGEAIRTRTRGALEAIGVTQPGWWVLHQLSLRLKGWSVLSSCGRSVRTNPPT